MTGVSGEREAPMPKGDDEHMNVPTWRMKQLQDIEHAARQAVELINLTPTPLRNSNLAIEIRDALVEALKEDE